MLGACRGGGQLDSLVTSGALLQRPADLTRIKVAAVRTLRRVLPRLATPADIRPDQLSRDPEVGRRYVADPLVLTAMTTSLGAELLGAMSLAERECQRLDIPILMLHGAEDRLCLPAGTKAIFSALAPERLRGSELHLIPGLRHEIFNEPERRKLFEQVLGWIRDREVALNAQQPAVDRGS